MMHVSFPSTEISIHLTRLFLGPNKSYHGTVEVRVTGVDKHETVNSFTMRTKATDHVVACEHIQGVATGAFRSALKSEPMIENLVLRVDGTYVATTVTKLTGPEEPFKLQFELEAKSMIEAATQACEKTKSLLKSFFSEAIVVV